MPVGDRRKIAIVGAGAVGSSVAYAVMISGLVHELVLVDINQERAEGEAMDLAHGASFVKPIRIYSGCYDDCRDADIIVFTAGAAQKPGETRLDLVFKNCGILKETLPEVIDREADTILLMVTNPVDILTHVALQLLDIAPQRVIGSGTVLDSSRFRYLLSEHCQVQARNIHAYVVGEHGDTEVPLWSLANIAGFSIQEFCYRRGIPFLDKEKISRQVREAAYEVIARKGFTCYAIGLAVKRICESILRDENSILTVSGLIEGQYGIRDVCFSLPCIVNCQGRVGVLALPVAPEEEEALHHSSSVLKSLQQQLQPGPLPEKAYISTPPSPGEYQHAPGYH